MTVRRLTPTDSARAAAVVQLRGIWASLRISLRPLAERAGSFFFSGMGSPPFCLYHPVSLYWIQV